MNLIYLTFLFPFIAFVILNSYGKHLKIDRIWLIGLAMPFFAAIVLLFCLIDYHHLTTIIEHFSYQSSLWNWFNLNGLSIDIGIYVDSLSLFFSLLIVILAAFVFPFAGYYLQTKEEVYRFFAYANLLLAILFLLIFADNLLLFLLAWQSISYCSYLMMGLKHKNTKTGAIAMKQLIAMHLTDLFLLIAIGLIFKNLDALNIQNVLTLASQNLATNSTNIYLITLFLFFAVISRIGLFPFHFVYGNTTMASVPVMTLLQTGPALIAGSYLMMRVEPLFYMSDDLLFIIGFIAMLTIIIAGSIALIQKDLKRIVSYFNLLQISTFFLVFTVQDNSLSLAYIFGYTLVNIFILILAGLLIQSCQGERNIDKLGGLYKKQPLIFGGFLVILLSLSAFPWISSFYYLKLALISQLMENHLVFLCFILILSMILTLLILCRIIIKLFLGEPKTESKPLKTLNIVPLFILGLAVLGGYLIGLTTLYEAYGLLFSPIFEFNSYQLLFIAVIAFALFMSYFFFLSKNPEINLIYKTPFSKKWTQWTLKEWYIDTLIHYIVIYPIHKLTTLIGWRPLPKLMYCFNRKANLIRLSVFFTHKKGIKRELMALILCCVILILLLTLL